MCPKLYSNGAINTSKCFLLEMLWNAFWLSKAMILLKILEKVPYISMGSVQNLTKSLFLESDLLYDWATFTSDIARRLLLLRLKQNEFIVEHINRWLNKRGMHDTSARSELHIVSTQAKNDFDQKSASLSLFSPNSCQTYSIWLIRLVPFYGLTCLTFHTFL